MNSGWKDSTAVRLVSRCNRCMSVPVGYSEVWKRGRIPYHTEEFSSFRALSVAAAMPLVASSGFGATRLADVCAAVEVEPESAAGRLEAMTVEYDRAVAELRAHLAELG